VTTSHGLIGTRAVGMQLAGALGLLGKRVGEKEKKQKKSTTKRVFSTHVFTELHVHSIFGMRR
jgi:hypothetical protein